MKFKVQSKKSFLGLIIKCIVFGLFTFSIISRLNLGSPFNMLVIIAFFTFFIYQYLNDRTSFEINNGKIICVSTYGFPTMSEESVFELEKVRSIKLIQTHENIYGKKYMELTDTDQVVTRVELKLRYYQLVQLQEYLNNTLKIKTQLIG